MNPFPLDEGERARDGRSLNLDIRLRASGAPLLQKRLRDIRRELRVLATPVPDRGGLAVVAVILLGLVAVLVAVLVSVSR